MSIHEPNWQLSKILSNSIPNSIRDSLLDPGSTTKYMRSQTIEPKIKLIFSGWGQPFQAELTALNIVNGEQVFIREVEIWCKDKLWMFARTVVPKSAVAGPMSRLCDLGERPLGDVIFQDTSTSRSQFELACLNSTHYLFQKTEKSLSQMPEMLWARRSILYVVDQQMLLSEVFTPLFGSL